MDFKGSDSNIISNIRGGILMSAGHFPESLSQAILVGIILVGKLGVGVLSGAVEGKVADVNNHNNNNKSNTTY